MTDPVASEDDNLDAGFNGFSRQLPDDSVEYIIYSIDRHSNDAASVRSRLNKILKTTQHLKKQYLKDYIWQRDDFNASLSAESGNPSAATRSPSASNLCLRGHTNFGDSIADEWLIVYLLLETSKRHSDAWIRVFDNDGEFLLIEAADALPKWLNPDIAENRVWISNGHLRIIPLAPDTRPGNLALHEALQTIVDHPESLIISPFIEEEAFHRIRDHPNAISASLHRSAVTIPRRLAYVLNCNPSYISPAIEAFYIRGPISVKPLATKDLAGLLLPPEDFITTSVRFTKVGYAQLQGQVFDTPPTWTGVTPRLVEPAVDIGMKLTCGFEMLLHDPQQQDHSAVREIKILLDDLDNGDDTLPTDAEIAAWPQDVDDEKWLDIDYRDFEDELAGKRRNKNEAKGTGFGDEHVQENLRKMVSRFEEFMNDEDAGIDGVNDSSDEKEATDESDDEEDKTASFDEADFEKAMRDMMGMPQNVIEETGLLDEARNLAIEDALQEEEHSQDETEDLKTIMRLMEEKLKSRGRPSNRGKDAHDETQPAQTSVVYGPERPSHLRKDGLKGKSRVIDMSDEESVGPGDGELSSDDEDDNNVDLEFAQNILEAFKGQAGTAGPAGNLMRALGVNMPRDEGE